MPFTVQDGTAGIMSENSPFLSVHQSLTYLVGTSMSSVTPDASACAVANVSAIAPATARGTVVILMLFFSGDWNARRPVNAIPPRPGGRNHVRDRAAARGCYHGRSSGSPLYGPVSSCTAFSGPCRCESLPEGLRTRYRAVQGESGAFPGFPCLTAGAWNRFR